MKVRLTLAEHWPYHGTDENRKEARQIASKYHLAKWDLWRGKEIEALNDHHGIPKDKRGSFFVCEHQIQLPAIIK